MPDDLQELLAQARRAGPLDRIEFRDRIAAHGASAVPDLIEWLPDDTLAGFAVRVLERIGREADSRQAAIDALVGARLGAAPPVRTDIDTVLAGLGHRATRASQRAKPAGTRPTPRRQPASNG